MGLSNSEYRDTMFGRLLIMLLRAKRKVITRQDNVPYLVRYTLFTNSRFSLKIHHILISDDECPHDHPWSFRSLILAGGYWEYTPPKNIMTSLIGTSNLIGKWYGPGRILYRSANWVHRIQLDKPAWTLVITYKKVKEWGFFTKKGFMNWKVYNPIKDR